jgi:hypothetical protein
VTNSGTAWDAELRMPYRSLTTIFLLPVRRTNVVKNVKRYVLYIHTNKQNQKSYIGITGQIPERRWKNGFGYKKHSVITECFFVKWL